MSKNIYDLFNERKYGMDCLVEGYDFEIDNDDEFESLEEAVEVLDYITMESTNEMLELQAACYLEDLVIENMMYEDFDEEKLKYVMESSEESKTGGFVEKIKALWQKVKQWFVNTFKTIVNHFKSGETLVAKYRKEIPAAMHQSKAKIKMRPFSKESEGAENRCFAIIAKLEAVGKSKEQILASAGISDKNGVKKLVDGFYYRGEDQVELKISEMDPGVVMHWAGGKKIIIDALKKQQKDVDGKFKSVLADLQKGDDGKKSETAANFQFAVSIINSILSHQINCVKYLSKCCEAIIRKALSGSYDPKKVRDTEAPDTKDVKDMGNAKKEYGYDRKLTAPTAPKADNAAKRSNAPALGGGSTKQLGESWEIIDEEDCDDFE